VLPLTRRASAEGAVVDLGVDEPLSTLSVDGGDEHGAAELDAVAAVRAPSVEHVLEDVLDAGEVGPASAAAATLPWWRS